MSSPPTSPASTAANPPASASLSRQQLGLVVLITVVWGFNWPVMKLGVSGYPPLSFRVLSMWLGLPVLYAMVRWQRVPLAIPRSDWPAVAWLTLTNMLVWHVVAMFALQTLSSGRAAILGYTMPIFSALWGLALFGQRLNGRQTLGVLAAAVGVALLLWHEAGQLQAGRWAALAMLGAAAVWALGTQQLRRTRLQAPTLAIVWWMSVLTTAVMSLLALSEAPRWHTPSPAVWGAILYNAVLIFGLAQPAWLMLARTLPPAASTLSVMLIPVLGTVSGALALGEQLYWQDAAALLLMGTAISSVLWPAKPARPAEPATPQRPA